MKILFFAFEFPPLASGGVHRAMKLVKYLSRLGVSIDVVTVQPEDYKTWSSDSFDEGLAKETPSLDSVRVHRIASGFPDWYWRLARGSLGFRLLQTLYWGDPVAFFWRTPLFALLDSLFAKQSFDVLLATVPPFGVAALARKTAHRFKIPWVVDWRDPWTLWRSVPFPSYAHYLYTRAQEGTCLGEANISICTSHVTREDWLREFRGSQPRRLEVVYNGFDAEAIDGVAAEHPPTRRMRIVYVGSFYYSPESRQAMMAPAWRRLPHRWLHYRKRREDWLYRSPYFFLKGLRHFDSLYPEESKTVEVIFAGVIPGWLPKMLEETGTAGRVELLGRVSHQRSLALQKGADAVLLTSAKVLHGRDYSIAGKLYEYLGMRKRILAVVTDGAMRDIVDQSGLGQIADPDDVAAVAEAIRDILRKDSCARMLEDSKEEYIQTFEAAMIARQMLTQLEAAAHEGYREGK